MDNLGVFYEEARGSELGHCVDEIEDEEVYKEHDLAIIVVDFGEFGDEEADDLEAEGVVEDHAHPKGDDAGPYGLSRVLGFFEKGDCGGLVGF